MRVILLNSAIMPSEGYYKLEKISKDEFLRILTRAYFYNYLLNYIGYAQNLDLIEKWTQHYANPIKLSPNRDQVVELKDGDVLIIMKLRYRVQDPSVKGMPVNEEDFEFYKAVYSKTKEGLSNESSNN